MAEDEVTLDLVWLQENEKLLDEIKGKPVDVAPELLALFTPKALRNEQVEKEPYNDSIR